MGRRKRDDPVHRNGICMVRPKQVCRDHVYGIGDAQNVPWMPWLRRQHPATLAKEQKEQKQDLNSRLGAAKEILGEQLRDRLQEGLGPPDKVMQGV